MALPAAKDLTLDQKASLTSGANAWHFQGIPERGIPGFMMTDGPHGLRKMRDGETLMDVSDAVPATCFPPAAGLSSTWNPALIQSVGEAIGEEALQEKVAVVLGPGINIKRHPYGGRNFEYFSEDPYLTGVEASGMVEGIQSKGIGTSLKHFAVNNQEFDRMRISADVDERALREIYLAAFEHVVKATQPWTVMCSYNKINGTYAFENSWLLTDVLRTEWGFRGMVMSDWGACHNRVTGIQAGLNLEMPPSGTDDEVVAAVARSGALAEAQLDAMAQGVIDVAAKATEAMARDYRYDVDQHADIARRAAHECMVLLKNEGPLLPLAADARIAVVGEFARTPRIQGDGSSLVSPTRLVSVLDALAERGVAAPFAPGFTLDDADQDPALTAEAVAVAADADVVVLTLGLPAQAESEGFDRTTLDIPAKQVEVLRAVAAANSRTVVVLSNGAVVSIAPWRDQAMAVVESWLLGQSGGAAVADALFGDVNVFGKLAETIPLAVEDVPAHLHFPGGAGHVVYGESVYVGYRYYDTVSAEVAYPFGFGLSYTTFAIHDLHVDVSGPTDASIAVTVTNTGAVAGAEVVQLYVAPSESTVQRPAHELKGFRKAFLEPGESVEIRFELGERAFAYWNQQLGDWKVDAGDYEIQLGSSSRDIAQRASITLAGDAKRPELGLDSVISEWRGDPIGGPLLAATLTELGAELPFQGTTLESLVLQIPLSTFAMFVPELSGKRAAQLVEQYRSTMKGNN